MSDYKRLENHKARFGVSARLISSLVVAYHKVDGFLKQIRECKMERRRKLRIVLDHLLSRLAYQDGLFTAV